MRRLFWPLRFMLILLIGAVCLELLAACSSPVASPPASPPPVSPTQRPLTNLHLTFQANKAAYQGKWTAVLLEQERQVLEKRTGVLNAQSVQVTAKMPDQLVVEAHGVPNAEQVVGLLQTTANLRFYWLPQLGNEDGTRRAVWCVSTGIGAGGKEQILTEVATRTPVTPAELDQQVFSQPPILSNKDLLPKCRAMMLSGGYPVIEFELNKEGAEIFKAFTRHHIGERLAIFLDQKLLTTPTVNGVIKGKGMIEGNLTLEAAQAVANQLNTGALPVPLTLIQKQVLDP